MEGKEVPPWSNFFQLCWVLLEHTSYILWTPIHLLCFAAFVISPLTMWEKTRSSDLAMAVISSWLPPWQGVDWLLLWIICAHDLIHVWALSLAWFLNIWLSRSCLKVSKMQCTLKYLLKHGFFSHVIIWGHGFAEVTIIHFELEFNLCLLPKILNRKNCEESLKKRCVKKHWKC